MTVEELITTYNILEERSNELYTQMIDAEQVWNRRLDEMKAEDRIRIYDEPLCQKYIQLSDETKRACDAFEAFKKLEWGCVREEGK